ncbi:flavin reductase like domain-containing protein [Colletotrichum plurivorum]|uniref:Flavin reductase like domain-containing protein n=1 Tax=Colletotrichum plurivorum TaxID=2175906 RepID=A0A8H6K9I3_9PEZI|nr:flavin reductase like domain-containing protein [Colletotrichum plurivorum]
MSGARVLANALRRGGRARVGVRTHTQRTQFPGREARSYDAARRIHTTPSRHSTFRAEPPQSPTAEVDTKGELPEQLRGVMRRLAHSVVVCTAADREGRPRGMTMSSFVSLSMDPVPLVTFNVRTPSRTLQAIQDEEGRFNVHVLAEGAEGARVAEWFTRGNTGAEVFGALPEGIEVVEEDGEAPVLEGLGVLFVLKCQVLGEGLVRVRDHVVVVGEVKEVAKGDGEGFGLVYADRQYRTLGEVLVKEGK